MHFVPFNQGKATRIETLYDEVDSISIETHSGFVYHNCTVTWEQGRTRSAEFDNYRFKHGDDITFPEDVAFVAFEDECKEQFMKDFPESAE